MHKYLIMECDHNHQNLGKKVLSVATLVFSSSLLHVITSCVLVISWTTIVVHSRDDQEVGVAHEVKSSENQPQFSQMTMGQ